MELLRSSPARLELALEGLLIISHDQVMRSGGIDHTILFRYPTRMGSEEAKAIARDFVAEEYQATGCHMWYSKALAPGRFYCSFHARW